ncbi:MFS transporter [Candidatus Desantisbacteria bacterium]|nr:MFS transporter [Candidatus Desantisbacteria bacterium]
MFFGGQSVSLVGTWIQQIAMGWLVYRLTGSALILGLVGFLSQIPVFFFTPFAGILIDRWDRRKLLIITQILATIQAVILFILVEINIIMVWHVIVLGIFLGFINVFDMPARQVFVFDIIEKKEDLGNAIALNSAMVNIARLLGPPLAGIFIAWKGEGICFLLNAISYFAAIIALFLIKISAISGENKSKKLKPWIEFKEGFNYAFKLPVVRSMIFLLALISLMSMSYQTLMPVFVKDILKSDAHLLGFLMGGSGLGALLGAFYLASRKNIDKLGKIIVFASGIFGLSLIFFSFFRSFWFCFFFIGCSGFGMMVQLAGCNTILQTIVPNDKRGRVMSIFITAFVGIMPFGSLLSGWLASIAGTPNTILICGIVTILGVSVFGRQISSVNHSV